MLNIEPMHVANILYSVIITQRVNQEVDTKIMDEQKFVIGAQANLIPLDGAVLSTIGKKKIKNKYPKI